MSRKNNLIMKKNLLYSLTTACVMLFNQSQAQMGTWKYQNPTPGPNGQNALEVVSADTVYVGGWGGYVSKTYNGGVTWQECAAPSNEGIGALEFINGMTGFTTGEVGKLYKTTNGGTSWTTITLPNPDWYIGDIKFVNQNVGFIGGITYGSNGDSSFVAKTINGGLTWTDLPNHKRMPNSIARIETFSTDSIYLLGFADGYDGTMFSCSHNSGLSWTNVKALPNVGSMNYNQGAMCFLNNNVGYLYCTTPDTILKTTNGGLTWVNGGNPDLSVGSDFFPNTLHYFNSNTAVAFASYGANVIYTTDGGANWTNGTQAANTSWIYSMKFVKNSTIGYANGGGGEVLKSINGGMSWSTVQSTLRNTQYGVDFSDIQNGLTCGNNGSIYKTTNGGSTYSALSTSVNVRLTGIQKIKNTQTIYACGFGGTVIKSTNDGSTWSNLTTSVTADLNSLFFINKDTGIVVGNNGTILKTTNGGLNWLTINASTTAKLNRVKIKDVNVYIASDTISGGNGVFYKSHNLGSTFNAISLPLFPESFFGLSFTNDSTGYMCGTTGTIIKTTNYGQTWQQQLANTTDEFFDIEFADDLKGIAVGNYGIIFETNDGGQTWNQNLCVIQVALYDLSYPNVNHAWGVGRAGGIAKFSNNFTAAGLANHLKSNLEIAIYPNPANEFVYIKSSTSLKTVELFNNLGALVDAQEIKTEKYTLPKNLATGIYFIRLKSDSKEVTKKLIIKNN